MTDIDNTLIHYGVKGMKWGVRRSQAQLDRAAGRKEKKKTPKHLRGEVVLDTKLKSGGSLVVRSTPPGPLMKALSKKFKSIRNNMESVHDFSLSNEKGEKVGEASFTQTGPNTLDLEWIGVRKAHRRNGYARAAMEGVVNYAKDHGITELKLTATGMGAPLYESIGFKKVGDGGAFEGEYSMRLDEKVEHSDNTNTLDPKVFAEYIERSINENLREEDEDVDEFPEDTLVHYGVKGMKWGVRRSQAQLDRAAGRRTKKARLGSYDPNKKSKSSPKKASLGSYSPSDDHAKSRRLMSKDVSELSNADLKVVNDRLNLETNYSRLTTKPQSAVRKIAGEVLKEHGKNMAGKALKVGTKHATKYVVDKLKK